MSEPHIAFEVERIARITHYLPREDIEKLLLKLVANFLQREAVLAQIITGLQPKEHQHE